jgi:hypothetical protein
MNGMNSMTGKRKLSFVSRTRCNHGLEHATINILSEHHPGLRLAGYSNPFGFTIIGQVQNDDLVNAIEEAQNRVSAGKFRLVLHDHCGTNLVAGGLLTGFAAWLATLGVRRGIRAQFERLPLVILFTTLAVLFSPAFGIWLQKNVTTSSEVQGLEIVKISQGKFWKYPRFYIRTRPQ